MLRDLVHLTVSSLATCPDPLATLLSIKPQKALPLTLKPKKKFKVLFDVPIACINDPDQTSRKSPGHEDYSLSAAVSHASLGGSDAHVMDDACPRQVAPPGVLDPYPDGKIREKGCGSKKSDRTLGAPVLIDVVLKR